MNDGPQNVVKQPAQFDLSMFNQSTIAKIGDVNQRAYVMGHATGIYLYGRTFPNYINYHGWGYMPGQASVSARVAYNWATVMADQNTGGTDGTGRGTKPDDVGPLPSTSNPSGTPVTTTPRPPGPDDVGGPITTPTDPWGVLQPPPTTHRILPPGVFVAQPGDLPPGAVGTPTWGTPTSTGTTGKTPTPTNPGSTGTPNYPTPWGTGGTPSGGQVPSGGGSLPPGDDVGTPPGGTSTTPPGGTSTPPGGTSTTPPGGTSTPPGGTSTKPPTPQVDDDCGQFLDPAAIEARELSRQVSVEQMLGPDFGGAKHADCVKSFNQGMVDSLNLKDLREPVDFSEAENMKPNVRDKGLCTHSPLVLDLAGDGVKAGALADGVRFDLLGNGQAVKTAWPAGDDAMLAMDRDGDGRITSGSELFGNAQGFVNGFATLAALDSNHDGVIDARDPAFGSLRLWRDANHDGVSQPAELATLFSEGIVALNLSYDSSTREDAAGNRLAEVGSFVRIGGELGQTGALVDVWFHFQP